jgi:hypothetical protein
VSGRKCDGGPSCAMQKTAANMPTQHPPPPAPEAEECVDVCCFVVAADEVHVARVLQLERQQQAHRLKAVAASASDQ